MKNNRNLMIIALVAIVNALGYGIIIPILYSYSKKFGLSDFENGMLFAVFSVCQFVSTPVIGRLSDKYGRRPLLLISILGTAVSFLMMAFAGSPVVLFLARALDGLTAGNIPVASAVISDTTTEKDRARGFGIIGAAFGFGFIFGPAISALTVGYWDSLPFVIAFLISLLAVVVTYLFLPETNKHMGEISKARLFDFGRLFRSLFDENVGVTLLITLCYFGAFSMFIYGFQPYTVKVLGLSANQISMLFTLFGVMGLVSQMLLVRKLPSIFGLKNSFTGALVVVAGAFLWLFIDGGLWWFVAGCVVLALSNTMVNPLTQTILSQEIDEKSQGSILGLQSSYMSIGQILGPVVAGVIAGYSLSLPFLAAGLMTLGCVGLSFLVLKKGVPKESAF